MFADDGQLREVRFTLNLRICVDFVFTVKDETTEGQVTNGFMKSVTVVETSAVASSPRTCIGL